MKLSSVLHKGYFITITEKWAGGQFNTGIKVAARVRRGRMNMLEVNVK